MAATSDARRRYQRRQVRTVQRTAIKNRPYYNICTPTEHNVGTGNVCFNVNDLAKFDKDFLFEQAIDGVEYSKVLPKEWVRDHMLPMYASKIDKYTGNAKVYQFYVLKLNEILAY